MTSWEPDFGAAWEPWYDLDESPMVCVVHKRFIPCRRSEPMCELSTEPKDVKMVREYQQGK